jgi:hypothetical protein
LWGFPLLLAGLARGFDAADRSVPFSVLETGLLDEPCHLATGALGLLALSCFVDVPAAAVGAGGLAAGDGSSRSCGMLHLRGIWASTKV